MGIHHLEVFKEPEGWTWQAVTSDGDVLISSGLHRETQDEAEGLAREYSGSIDLVVKADEKPAEEPKAPAKRRARKPGGNE